MSGPARGDTEEQLGLVRAKLRTTRPKPPPPITGHLPVAKVAVDVSFAHLDRPFDYLVPEPMADSAVPGCRVRVRFAGKLVDGFVLDRVEASNHAGQLAALSRVQSPVPVLAREVAGLARLVADRYAGTLADVLRLAIPRRHAAAERTPTAVEFAAPPTGIDKIRTWRAYSGGPALLGALERGGSPRGVWTALPGSTHWSAAIAEATRATLASGRSVVVVVPDHDDVARLDRALAAELGPGHHTTLTAELGAAERYRRFLACLRSDTAAIVGTRAAAFAPVANLGLVVCWDDGNDLHEEPRAPYPHAREVLALRAHATGAAALIGGFAMTAEGAQLVASGWARRLAPDRASVRAAAPRVTAAGGDAELARDPGARTARLPTLAWQTARDALPTGPVLVQVPRTGYLPALACARCRTPARCSRCQGPLALASGAAGAACRWCGAIADADGNDEPRAADGWVCPECGHGHFRALAVGAGRTAEELGRAFPGTLVLSSTGAGRRPRVTARSALVVATPGAEPVADDGYAAALLLDGWALLDRADLRASEEALRRWMNAAALTKPAAPVVVVADSRLRPVQALIRWDPGWYADRELAERTALGFPPAVRMAAVDGTSDAVGELLELANFPEHTEILGPVPTSDGRVRALVRTDRRHGPALATALRQAQGVRTARKAPDAVRIEVDPHPLG